MNSENFRKKKGVREDEKVAKEREVKRWSRAIRRRKRRKNRKLKCTGVCDGKKRRRKV